MKSLDILFFSRLIPKEVDDEVRAKMSNTMDDAAIAWQYHIVDGIEQQLGYSISLMNFLPVKSYPKHYKDAFVQRFSFSHTEGAIDTNIPFCNVQYIKRLFQGRCLYQEVKKWAKKEEEKEKVIIAYSLYPEFVEALRAAKLVNPKIITHAIVLDLPQYSILTKRVSTAGSLYLKWSKAAAYKRLHYIDSFTLLTSEMADALEIRKPYVVIEGICTEEFSKYSPEVGTLKTIIYAGTLHERFGILKLLQAFELTKNDKYRLVICGYGDSEAEIQKYAALDFRIDFRGQLKRSDVLELMKSATVIVNPRGNDEVFTKYSFPSKNIEAISSGVPFICYKLDGIPDEYDTFINYPKDDSVKSLTDMICSICNDESGAYKVRADKARKWILETKNSRVQGEKIIDIVKGKK